MVGDDIGQAGDMWVWNKLAKVGQFPLCSADFLPDLYKNGVDFEMSKAMHYGNILEYGSLWSEVQYQ